MERFCLLAILFLLVISSIGFAHPDSTPTVRIVAINSVGYVVDVVDTDVVIWITAEDEGFNAGLSSLQLLDNGNFVARKECFYNLDCEMRVNVNHAISGNHVFTAIAIDAGQNRKQKEILVKFRGVEQPPVLSFIEKAKVEEGRQIVIDIVVSDRNNDVVSLKAEGLPRGAKFVNGKFFWTPDFEQSGTYRITFTAVDSLGMSDSKTLIVDVLNKNREPTISYSELRTNITMYEDETRKFSLNVIDPDTKKPRIEWRLDGVRVSDSSSYSYRPNFRDAGDHILAVTINDTDYVVKKTYNIHVLDTNRLPTLGQLNDKEVTEGDRLKFTISGEDRDQDPLTYSADGLPKGSTFNSTTRIFEWKTKKGDAGRYQVVFKVRDDKGGMAFAPVNIRVLAPIVTSHEEYHESLRRAAERERLSLLQQQVGTGIIGAIRPPQNITTQQICSGDYLCYMFTYFVR